jgi:hypothetical protein
MGRLNNRISTAIELWKRIKHLKNHEDGDSAFSETSGRSSATRYQVNVDIFYRLVLVFGFECCLNWQKQTNKQTPWPLVRERTMPTD